MRFYVQTLVAICIAAGTVRAANPVVVMETSMGTIKIELFEDKAPITVKNFLSYIDGKHYDNTIFHRVIGDFMIQGGAFDIDRKQKKSKDPIKNEWQNGLKNERGTIAMARMEDPDTAADQFFINVQDNSSRLSIARPDTGNAGYCVFGKVVDGMDIVDKIKAVRTTTAIVTAMGPNGLEKAPFRDVPTDNVVIKSVKKVEEKKLEPTKPDEKK